MLRENAGVVHQHIDAPARRNVLPQPLGLGGIAEVGLDESMTLTRQRALR